MIATQLILDAFAELLKYPDDHMADRLSACETAVKDCVLEAYDPYVVFREALERLSMNEQQELFTRTFDHNPRMCLEIGWHLYGENYYRGALLVEMRQLLRRLHIPESVELPDHLSHVLLVLGRIPHDDAATLATQRVLPAVERLQEGFEHHDSAYRELVEALRLTLVALFGTAARAGVPLPIVENHDALVSMEDGHHD